MKRWNCKRLALPLSGLLLLALILPGLAQTQKQRRLSTGTLPTKTGAKGPTGPVLKAKTNPQIIAHKRTPKPFVAFTLKDLKDKSGKTPTANTMLTLYNGHQVSAQKHLTAANELEKKLNTWGYSLRDKQPRVTIQELAINKAKLNAQPKAAYAFKKGDARSQALATSPKLLQQEYAQTAKSSKTAHTVARPIAGGVLAPVLQPITVTKTFQDGWGDPSIFGAAVNAQLTVKGDQNSTGISAEGRATGSAFGYSKDLLLTTANVTAPRSGGMSAQFKVSTLGVDQVVLDHSEAASWTKTDSFGRSLPDNLNVQYDFTIGPIPCVAHFGLKGSVDMPYFVGLMPGSSTGWMIPEVQSSVYGQAAAGGDFQIWGVDVGLEAGLEAQLTLLNNKLTVAAGVDQGTDTKGTFVKYWYTSRDDFTTLAGKVLAYVQAQLAGSTVERWDYTIFTFGGIKETLTPFLGGETAYLQRPVMKQ